MLLIRNHIVAIYSKAAWEDIDKNAFYRKFLHISGKSSHSGQSGFKSTINASFFIFYLGYTESLSFSFSPPPGWQDLLKKGDFDATAVKE